MDIWEWGHKICKKTSDAFTELTIGRNSFLDNVIRDPVRPSAGDVIVCDLSPIPGLSLLRLNVEHTGIYAGGGKIIHKNGDGMVEAVNPSEFIARKCGRNFAFSVYVSCRDDKPLCINGVYARACEALLTGSRPGYNLLTNNCHHFTRYCLTGQENRDLTDFTFTALQHLLISAYGMNNWRVWKYD